MPLAPTIVADLSRRLHEHAGLELPAWVVEARATARIAALAVTPAAYVELIGSARGASELRELVEAVRVGESSLFRHRSQIAALVDVIAPALRGRSRRIRVWSAGCAAGQEPYTLAIVLARALPAHTISILATDVSADALAAAHAATYPAAEIASVPEEYRDAFVVEGAAMRVRREYASLVRFERANIMDALPPKACDVVWCRNVLIYFSETARLRAVDRLVSATLPGGFVFVGYSESLRDIPELEPQRAGDATYYVRKGDWTSVERTPVPVFTKTPPPMRVSSSPGIAVPALPASDEALLALSGTPNALTVTQAIGERLARGGVRRLVIDLDAADLLGDDLAPVMRRARAAATTAGIELVLRATRTGARRWLSRHNLEDAP